MNSNNSKNQLINRFVISNTVGIAVIAGLIFFIVLPSVAKLDTINTTITEQLKNTETKKGVRLMQSSKNISINSIESSLNDLTAGFVSKTEEVDFIYSIENLATQFSLLSDLSIGEKKQMTDYQQSDIQIVVQGKYLNELNYLNALKKLKYKVSINSISLSQGSASGSENVNMTISATVFWQ